MHSTGSANSAKPARNTAKTHISSAHLGDIPNDLLRCAQCNADGPPLRRLKGSNPPLWLHPECQRFWLKDHPAPASKKTNDNAELAPFEEDFPIHAREYWAEVNYLKEAGCPEDEARTFAKRELRERMAEYLPPHLVDPAVARIMQIKLQ